MERSFIAHPINVQFIHRYLAYLLLGLILFWYVRAGSAARKYTTSIIGKARHWPAALVLLQVALGIVTVLCAPFIVFAKFGTYETLAELHQLFGMFLLMSLVANLYIVSKQSA
jgi:cytochrome c oxidase assembly protein subunit 15